jgi:SAM-dependent methyltransferase
LSLGGEPFRWELYDSVLEELLPGSGVWLDLGCGETDFVAAHEQTAYGVGIDMVQPPERQGPFVRADLAALPVRSASVGLVSLRFVLEHIRQPEEIWEECRRVLVPGGRLLVMTTNRHSPVVASARLVPGRLRRPLIARLFSVSGREVQRTFHRWNTPRRLCRPPEGFELERIEFVEALDWNRRWVFSLLLAVATLTRSRFLRHLRSNILVVYRRKESE